MAVDQKVRETIDSFTTRLRRDLDAHLGGLLTDTTRLLQEHEEFGRLELEQAVTDARAETEKKLQAELEKVRTDLTRELGERVTSERTKMRDAHIEAFSRLLTAVRRLDEVTSLSGILETLARGSAVEASRVAVFIVDGDAVRTWGHFGFATGQAPVDVSPSDAALLRTVMESKQPAFMPKKSDGTGAAAPGFARLAADHSGVIVPIIVGGEAVGALYADGPDRRPEREQAMTWAEHVELLARHASLRLENVTSVRTVDVMTKPA